MGRASAILGLVIGVGLLVLTAMQHAADPEGWSFLGFRYFSCLALIVAAGLTLVRASFGLRFLAAAWGIQFGALSATFAHLQALNASLDAPGTLFSDYEMTPSIEVLAGAYALSAAGLALALLQRGK